MDLDATFGLSGMEMLLPTTFLITASWSGVFLVLATHQFLRIRHKAAWCLMVFNTFQVSFSLLMMLDSFLGGKNFLIYHLAFNAWFLSSIAIDLVYYYLFHDGLAYEWGFSKRIAHVFIILVVFESWSIISEIYGITHMAIELITVTALLACVGLSVFIQLKVANQLKALHAYVSEDHDWLVKETGKSDWRTVLVMRQYVRIRVGLLLLNAGIVVSVVGVALQEVLSIEVLYLVLSVASCSLLLAGTSMSILGYFHPVPKFKCILPYFLDDEPAGA